MNVLLGGKLNYFRYVVMFQIPARSVLAGPYGLGTNTLWIPEFLVPHLLNYGYQTLNEINLRVRPVAQFSLPFLLLKLRGIGKLSSVSQTSKTRSSGEGSFHFITSNGFGRIS